MEFYISTCAPLFSCHWTPLRKVWIHLPHCPHIRHLYTFGRSPWISSSTGWAVPAPTSPCLMDAPRPKLSWWSFSGPSPCLSHTGESRSRLLQMCLPGAEQRGRIIPLDMVAVLCPTAATFSTRDAPWTWLMFNLPAGNSWVNLSSSYLAVVKKGRNEPGFYPALPLWPKSWDRFDIFSY